MYLKPLALFFFLHLGVITSIICQGANNTNPPRKTRVKNDQLYYFSCAALRETNHRMSALQEQNAHFRKDTDNRWTLIEKKLETNNEIMAEIKKVEESQESIKAQELENVYFHEKIEKKLEENRENLEKIHQQQSEQNKRFFEEIKRLENNQNEMKALIEGKFAKIEEILSRLDASLKQIEKNFSDKTPKRPKNCKDVRQESKISGVYTVNVSSSLQSFDVYCDMRTRGGGWTYILRRFDGSQNFEMDWTDYENGFGDLYGEFWLGLEPVHQLTNAQNELLVEMVDWSGKKSYAYYNKFKIGAKKEGYPLKVVGGYSGNAGDGLSSLVNMKFTTRDRDQDNSDYNCAQDYKGAWWHKNCYVYINGSKLTGLYLSNTDETFNKQGIHWIPFRTGSLKEVTMMIRPANNARRGPE